MYKPEIDIELYLRNVNQYKWLITLMFVVTSLALAIAGYNKEKVYSSYSTLELGSETIITPIIGEGAVTAASKSIADRAEELVFSRKFMGELARRMEVVDGEVDTQTEEIAVNLIQSRVSMNGQGDNYIQLLFEDADPYVAKKGAEQVLELYMAEETSSRESGAGEAYDMINEQVQRIESELAESEEQLKAYKNEKIDSGFSSEDDINRTMISYQSELTQAKLDLSESEIQYATLSRQLESEARETVNVGMQSEIQKRIDLLNLNLAELRTNYYDDYPDIVEVKREIANQKALLRKEKTRAKNTRDIDDRVYLNEAYQEMKLNRNAAKTRMDTLRTRVSGLEKNIVTLQQKGKAVLVVDAKLAKLNRDYDTKQGNYVDFKARLETARMTQSLATDSRQSDITIYEAPFLPVSPSGLRFMHYLLGGLMLGLGLPLGLIYLLQFFSQQVKSKDMLTDMGIPVMVSMGKVKTQVDTRVEKIDKSLRYMLVGGTFLVLATMVVFKVLGRGVL